MEDVKEKYKYEISVYCSLNGKDVKVEVESQKYVAYGEFGYRYDNWDDIREILQTAEKKHQAECGHSYDWDLSNGCHYKNCDGIIDWDCEPKAQAYGSKWQ
tara:strand:- start:50 stop:352 length:303 start_codon:yes stop_codon:yes gene_type:complete